MAAEILTSLLEGKKMLWRNDLLPETIEMKVDFCVKLTTKSTKADAKDQDQCSEIHRITW